MFALVLTASAGDVDITVVARECRLEGAHGPSSISNRDGRLASLIMEFQMSIKRDADSVPYRIQENRETSSNLPARST